MLSQESGQVVSGEPAQQRGGQLVQQWLDEHQSELNPVFGEYNKETGLYDSDSLSVPVSDLAKDATDSSKVTAEQTNALPAEQRCGPVAKDAEKEPAA